MCSRCSVSARFLVFALGVLAARAADPCCATSPEMRLWDRFATQARMVAAHGGNPLPVLQPAPAGVSDLACSDLFLPDQGRGLVYTDKARQLDGTLVRIAGFMVKQQTQAPGLLLFTGRPCSTTECEDGLCDDLPPATIHVIVPEMTEKRVPLTAGPLVLIGRLELGSHHERDGRNSVARLVLVGPSPFNADSTPALSASLPVPR